MKNFPATSVVLFSLLLISRISIAQPGALDPAFANGGISEVTHTRTEEFSKDIALTVDGKMLVLSTDYSYNFLLRFLPNGNPDSSFGINGSLKILIGEDPTHPSAIAVDSLNRILVISSYNDIFIQKVYVYRLLADGSTDVTFGTNGKTKAKFDYAGRNLIIQPDGKIVISGSTGNTSGDSRIERLNEDGSVDLSFGGNGWLSLDAQGTFEAAAMALDTANNILVTGSYNNSLYVARILPTGELDSSFSGNGFLTFNNDGSIQRGRAIAAMTGGEIVVTGFCDTHFASKINCWRFLHDGTLDTSFGNNGVVKLDSAAYFNIGWFLIPNPDSSLIVGGSVYNINANAAVLFKLRYDGTPDLTFGDLGMSQKAFSSTRSIEINGVQTSDGKIVLTGTEVSNGNNQTAVSQFLPDGSADASFGMNGTTSISLSNSMIFGRVDDFAVLPNGNILCAAVAGSEGLNLYRLSSDGIFDTTYGQGGWLCPDMEWFGEQQLIAARDSSIYVVTYGEPCIFVSYDEINISYPYNDHSMFGVLKLRTDGTVDSSFGNLGMAHPVFSPGQIGIVESAAVQPDGKLLVAGTTPTGLVWPGNVADSYLIRFNTDGTLDLSFGDQGIVIIDIALSEGGPEISTLDDGKIIFAEVTVGLDLIYSNKMLRLMPDGSIDATFGASGIADLGYFGGQLLQVPIIRQPDNKIILVVGPYEYRLLRVRENGIIDSTFGNNGYSNPFYPTLYPLSSIQVDQNGRILCYGKSYNIYGTQDFFTVLRLKNDGTFDSAFGNGGKSNCDSGSYVTRTMHLQPDGKILISGGKSGFYVARLLIDYPTGLTNNEADLSVLIFPNPVQDQLMMKHSFSSQENATITVVNILGKVFHQHEIDLSGDVLSEDVADLTSGIYTLTLKTNAGVISAKFVKE